MLVCFRCRGEIPGDSHFCPICGAKTADADGADTQRDELGSVASLGDAPTDLAEPPARRTMVMSPAHAQPHVPPGPAPQFLGPVGPLGPVGSFGPPGPPMPHPYAPPVAPMAPMPPMHVMPPGVVSSIPITPSPARIALGVMLAAIALWLAVWMLPRLGDDVTTAGRVGATAVGLLGVVLVIFGLLHRDHAEVMCRMCRRPVIAWKGAFGLHCPLAPHLARVDWLMIVLTATFWLGALATLIVGLVLFV